MADIHCVWWGRERMSFACCHLLNLTFDSYSVVHHSRYDSPPLDGGILVFHGGQACSPFPNGAIIAQDISAYIARWRYAILISIGDEASEFPCHLLQHPNFRLWVQAPRTSVKADRYLIQGYPDHTARADVPRDLDYFFSGQVTHDRRRQCVHALVRYWESNPRGIILQTTGFGQGLPQPDYLSHMSRARVVPCPAGPATPDTFRVYESLECGAIPILDSRSLADATQNVWPLLLGDSHPLPIVGEWAELPDLLPELLANWATYSRMTATWWSAYKWRARLWLAQDLLSLGARTQSEVTV